MDLELIGKKMLEALAVQGQITAMQTGLLELERGIAKASNDIQGAQEAKVLGAENREQSEIAVLNAVDNAEVAKQQVAQAKANLKSAELVIEQAEKELAKYSDSVLSDLDKTTQQFQLAKEAIEAERDKAKKELEVSKKDLEIRQTELKVLGIDLNIGGMASQPRVTTL